MLLLMINEIPRLSNSDLQSIARVSDLLNKDVDNFNCVNCFCMQARDLINEPAILIPRILETAESRHEKSTNIDLIYCRLSRHMPDHSEKVSHDLLTLIENMDVGTMIGNDKLFWMIKTKRYINAKDIYRKYWEKVADDMKALESNAVDIDLTLSTLSYHYCRIQKGMFTKYRCTKFESLLKELALIEIKYGVSGWKPNRITKLGTFLIGCAYDPATDYVTLPEYFVKKIEEMAPQFTINEIVDISIGIETFHRNGIPKQ